MPRRRSNASAIVPAQDMRAIQDANNNGVADHLEGVIDAQYRVISQGAAKTYPIYPIDLTKMGASVNLFRAVLSNLRHRHIWAVGEWVLFLWVLLCGGSFALNLSRTEPVSITNVGADPTAFGAGLANFVRPILGYTAGELHDAQIDKFVSDQAEVSQSKGFMIVKPEDR